MMEAAHTSETLVDNYFTLIALIMEAARASETSVKNYFTRQYIPEDKSELHTRRHENLKSHMKVVLWRVREYFQSLKKLLSFPPPFGITIISDITGFHGCELLDYGLKITVHNCFSY
jgi:hypothetical protein